MVYRKAQQCQGVLVFWGFSVIIQLKKSSFLLMLEVGQFTVCGLKALLTV